MSKIVTYEQAVELRALDFDRECNDIYWSDECLEENYGKSDWNNQHEEDCISAPAVSDALDFIREERGIRCAVELTKVTNRFGAVKEYKYGGAYIGKDNKEILLNEEDTHPLAESALLNAVLEYLEKGGENE